MRIPHEGEYQRDDRRSSDRRRQDRPAYRFLDEDQIRRLDPRTLEEVPGEIVWAEETTAGGRDGRDGYPALKVVIGFEADGLLAKASTVMGLRSERFRNFVNVVCPELNAGDHMEPQDLRGRRVLARLDVNGRWLNVEEFMDCDPDTGHAPDPSGAQAWAQRQAQAPRREREAAREEVQRGDLPF